MGTITRVAATMPGTSARVEARNAENRLRTRGPAAPSLPLYEERKLMYSVLYYTIHKVFAEPTAVSRLEELFRLEIDFQRRLRTAGAGAAEAAELHTSYALAAGYEPLMRALRGVTAEEIERLDQQFAGTGDPRDLMAARASLQQFLVNRNADI